MAGPGLLTTAQLASHQNPKCRHSAYDSSTLRQHTSDHAVPGRLLYTRVATEPPISLISIYQHCWTTSSSTTPTVDKLLDARETVWSRLHHLLDHIPRRHQLVTLGDFNTQCVPPEDSPQLARTASRIDKAHSPPERLPANAEHPSRSPPSGSPPHLVARQTLPPTLQDPGPHPPGPRIDFILCREHRRTRQAHALKRAPFVPITGNRHLPLTVTMPCPDQRLLPRRRVLDSICHPQGSGSDPRLAATVQTPHFLQIAALPVSLLS